MIWIQATIPITENLMIRRVQCKLKLLMVSDDCPLGPWEPWGHQCSQCERLPLCGEDVRVRSSEARGRGARDQTCQSSPRQHCVVRSSVAQCFRSRSGQSVRLPVCSNSQFWDTCEFTRFSTVAHGWPRDMWWYSKLTLLLNFHTWSLKFNTWWVILILCMNNYKFPSLDNTWSFIFKMCS